MKQPDQLGVQEFQRQIEAIYYQYQRGVVVLARAA